MIISALAIVGLFFTPITMHAKTTDEIDLKRGDIQQDKELLRERNLYVKFYYNFYQSIKDKLGIKDLQKYAEDRFDQERTSLKVLKQSLKFVRIAENGELITFVIFKLEENEGKQRMRIVQFALDPECDINKIIVLKQDVFKLFPSTVYSMDAVLLKDSILETQLLKQFGFIEGVLDDKSYDATLYAYFELKKDIT